MAHLLTHVLLQVPTYTIKPTPFHALTQKPIHALQHRRTHPLKQIQTLPIRTEEYTERKISFTTFIFFCLYFIISTNFVFNTKGPKNNECNFSFYNSTLTTFNKKFLDINFEQGLGTIAMGRNGKCVSEMTYTVYAPLPKIQFTLLHIQETERYPKLQKLNLNFHMAKTILLPIFSLFLITLGHWLERKSPFRYTNITFRYFFLKSRKHAPPKEFCTLSLN